MSDWEARFNAPQIAYAAIAARHPTRGVVIASRDANATPGLYAWDRSADTVRLLVNGAGFGGIAPDGAYIYYFDDDAGMYQRVAFTSGTPEPIATDLAPYRSDSISQSIDGRWLGFSTVGNETVAYRVAVGADGTLGARTKLYTSDSPLLGPLFSADGTTAVIATTDRGNGVDFALLALEMDGESDSARVLQENDGSLLPVAFSPRPGDARLLATTDVTGSTRPVIWDTSTGDRVDLPLEDIEGDISAWGWSADATQILLYRLHRVQSYLYVYDLTRSTLSSVDIPSGTLYNGFFDADGQIFVTHSDHAHPARLLALDTTREASPQVILSLAEEALPAAQPWHSVTFASGGGAMIQAWLATPDAAQFGDGPYPLVIDAHDGPFDVTTDAWNPEASAWLDHGFVWMSVNYRGSVSFGREHQLSILGIPGHREVDDLAAAVHYCVENGIAYEDKVVLNGEGYGGYLVLQALGRRPDLWAAGIATAPLANITLALPDLPEALRGFYVALMGATPEERPDLYRASSPRTYLDAVSAPLMLCLPANDPRCPGIQINEYARALRKRGDVRVQTVRYSAFDGPIFPFEQRLSWARHYV